MNTKNIVLRAAVAMTLSTLPFITQATVYEPGKPITLAREIDATNVTVPFGVDFALTLPNSLGGLQVDPGVGVSVIVRLTLTNGATFASDISLNSLKCQYTAAAASTVTAIYSEAGGSASALFRLASGTLAASSYCLFSGGVVLASGTKDAGYGMIVSSIFDTNNVGENKSDVLSGSIISFQDAFSFTITPPPDVTIDVTKPAYSTKFVVAAPATNDGTTAVMGNISYKSLASSTAMVPATLVSAAVTDVLGSLTLTLSGTPLTSRGSVSVTAVATNCTTTTVMTASTSGIVTLNIPAADLGNATNGLTLCYHVDAANTTKIEKGSVTFGLTGTGFGTAKPNFSVASSDNVLVNFTKNGTSVKVLNIPNVTEATTGNSVNVRVYNMGATDAEVTGTLYETDPANIAGKVTPTIILGTVKPLAVMVLKPADLERLFGKTWAGRAWLQLEGGSKDLRVMALMSTNGVLVNMSDRVVEDGGKGCRGGSC